MTGQERASLFLAGIPLTIEGLHPQVGQRHEMRSGNLLPIFLSIYRVDQKYADPRRKGFGYRRRMYQYVEDSRNPDNKGDAYFSSTNRNLPSV